MQNFGVSFWFALSVFHFLLLFPIVWLLLSVIVAVVAMLVLMVWCGVGSAVVVAAATVRWFSWIFLFFFFAKFKLNFNIILGCGLCLVHLWVRALWLLIIPLCFFLVLCLSFSNMNNNIYYYMIGSFSSTPQLSQCVQFSWNLEFFCHPFTSPFILGWCMEITLNMVIFFTIHFKIFYNVY